MTWYRKNPALTQGGITPVGGSNNWVVLGNIYRKNSNGTWVKLRRIYRKNPALTQGGITPVGGSNNWVIVHDSDSLVPYYTETPTLKSNAYLDSLFQDGKTLTLTRGVWANTGSSYSPVSYSLKIQYSADQTNWTDAATGTGTTLTYTISLSDVRSPSYYFRGRVTATNNNGSSTYTTAATRSTMDLSVQISAYVANNQIFSNWSYNKTNNSSNIVSQQINVKTNVAYEYNGNYYNQFDTVHSFSVPVGTSLANFSISGTNIKPATSIYLEIIAVANDSAGTEAEDISSDFTSPIPVGTVSISPSFTSPLRVESGSQVFAVPQGWADGTTFTYEWYRTRSFSSQDDISLGSASSINGLAVTSSSSTTGERIYVIIYGTYAGQTSAPVFSEYYRIIPAPPSFTLGGGDYAITITGVTATGGEYYFGTYSGPSSGTIPQTDIGTNYTIPGTLPSGTYQVFLFSRAINGSTPVTTESNSSTLQSKSIVQLTPPTSVSISSVQRFDNSNVLVILSHSGGTGPYYQMYWTSQSSAPATASYDAAGSGSSIFDVFPAPDNTQFYFYVRSSTVNLGTTTNNGTASAGTYSSWSSLSPNPSYTFFQPTGGFANSTNSSGFTISSILAGQIIYLSYGSASGSPSPVLTKINWRRNDGGFGGNTFTNGSIVAENTTSYTTTTSDIGYSIRPELLWNNGVGGGYNLQVNGGAVSVQNPVIPPVNTAIPVVTPSSGTAGTTQFSSTTGSWNNNPTFYSYQWQYRESAQIWPSAPGTNTNSTYTPPSNFASIYGNSLRCTVTAGNSAGSNSASSSPVTVNSPPSIPTGGSVTLSGGNTAGSVITASTSSGNWNNSPTSYDVFITTSTSGTPTSGNSRVSSSNGSTSCTYTITLTDAISPVNIFRAFATASNSAGTSSPPVQSSTIITTQASSSTPTTPGTPTLEYVPANNTPNTWGYSASWGASSGSGTIKYQIDAQGSSGGTATLPLESGTTRNFNLNKNNNEWRIRVRATNDNGNTWSSYSGYSDYE